ncbi:lipocalin family protein [Jiulongibacter sp. NS-SX5]|uniref:lipocalin family protein n=1 Tax=Jiulongibacter sp. NS-SX5 TaxID=3463854 RepID=UPI0040592634
MRKINFLFILLSVFLVSCAKEDPNPQAQIEGEWSIQHADYTVQYVEEDTYNDSADYSSSNGSIVFNADGTYTTTVIDDPDSEVLFPENDGTYTLSDGVLTLTYLLDGTEASTYYNVNVNGDMLTLSMDKQRLEETIRSEISATPELLVLFDMSLEEIIALFMEELVQFETNITFSKKASV